jgi:TetR/AcrR family transcriptional regulator, transcriptional repressor for nem operon
MAMKTTSPKTPEDTRNRILQAAFEQFYRNGFQGGSLNQIVEEAGTTKGALFHHFNGKNELGYAVVEEVVAPRIKARWFDPLVESVDPITDLKHLFEQTMEHAVESGHLVQGCPLNNLAQEMSQLDEGLRKRILNVYAMWRECLTEAFERGIEAGNVRKDISPVDVSAFIVAALAGIIGTAKNSRSGELVRQAGEAFFGYLESLRPVRRRKAAQNLRVKKIS